MGAGTMQLEQLFLENYRGIDSALLDFQGKSTVFFGINGAGKSSFLRGINLLFAHIINRIAANQFRQQISLTRDDVRFGSSKAKLYGQFSFENQERLRYGFSYNKGSNILHMKKDDLQKFRETFTNLYLTEETETAMMPVFAFYGINRAVFDVPLRIRKTHEFGRLEAFQNAIESKTDFRTFFEWFRNQEDIENEQKNALQDFSYTDPALNAVKEAIYKMLPELSDLRISRRPRLQMCANKNGQTLNIEQLSDGEKCILAMLGDLARRLALANPHSKEPLQGGGIVLIDEIELHMHPSWQRKILPLLHETFPKIQFIVTTHSPQVLGEIPADFNLFLLTREESDPTKIKIDPKQPGYYDSNLILEDMMDTPSVDMHVTELEGKIFAAIEEKNYDKASSLVKELYALTNGKDPAITRAMILIRRAKAGL